MKQSTIFMRGEGDRWYRRNLNKSQAGTLKDPVIAAIEQNQIKPTSVLEIGCSDGARLVMMKSMYGCRCYGLDPSKEAISDAPKGMTVWRGTADKIDLPDDSVDMVIYGFCLYLVDRSDLFRIVAECDRVLRDPGFVIIHDFHDYSNKDYSHNTKIRSYHYNYSKLWLGHPNYVEIYGTITNQEDYTGISIIQKV